ncbi:MAG: MBL fold metallo-hydrolase [Candidatus Lokiarchaeota archaeon]
MVQNKIIVNSGKVNEYLHHIDLKEFGKEKILSCYVCEFDDYSIFLDCGTSLEIKRTLNYCEDNQINLSKFKYLITTHHHFDHNGGLWLLYEKLKQNNPNFKIITNPLTKNLLNNFEDHLSRAKRTFGTFIGEMRSIENKAFKLIEPIDNFPISDNNYSPVDTFYKNGEKFELVIFKTPGHTPDHQCIVLIKNGVIDSLFLGEAAGTVYHSTELITMPTSMPVYYNHQNYMESLHKLQKLKGINLAGFCHFGLVSGSRYIHKLLKNHEDFMREFRNKIIAYYKEKPETRYIYKKIYPFLTSRTDLMGNEHPIMKNIVLGVIYGMMMDLGYRKE